MRPHPLHAPSYSRHPKTVHPGYPSRVPRSLRSPPQTTGFDLSSEPLKAQTPRLRLSPPSRDPAAKSSKDLSAGHRDPASQTLAPGTPPHPAPAACCMSTSPTPPTGLTAPSALCPAAVEAPSSAPQVNTVICPGGSASRQEQLLWLSALHPSRAQAQAHTCMHTHTCVHTCICTRVCTLAQHAHACVHCTHAHTHTCEPTHTRMCTHSQVHNVHTHACTHAHTGSGGDTCQRWSPPRRCGRCCGARAAPWPGGSRPAPTRSGGRRRR